jgi:hypothetical protein
MGTRTTDANDGLAACAKPDVRHDHRHQCVSVVSGTIAHQPCDSALVRRNARRVNDLHAVLSDAVVRRVCLRASDGDSLAPGRAGGVACGVVACGGGRVADFAGCRFCRMPVGSRPVWNSQRCAFCCCYRLRWACLSLCCRRPARWCNRGLEERIAAVRRIDSTRSRMPVRCWR